MLDRVYPSYLAFAQATGRWSVIKPPMGTLPFDYREMYIPDENEVWIEFDWNAIEARIFACLGGDDILLEAFHNDWDVHTINVCDLFDWEYPPNLIDPHESEECWIWRNHHHWYTKDDPRRVYAKSFLYGLIYGLEPYSAPNLPGSDRLGVPKDSLVDKAQAWLKKHPAVTKYRKATERQIVNWGYNTSAYGRRRYFLEYNIHRKVKQALDNPMQSTAADIMNQTIIRLWELTKNLGGGIAWPMHDGIKWRLHNSPAALAFLPKIKEIVQEPRELNGIVMQFPADFNIKYGDNNEKHT